MQADPTLGPRPQSANHCTAPVAQIAAGQPDEWVVAFRSEGAAPPLFCVCSGGGDVTDFSDLVRNLPLDQPVYGFSIPPMEEQFPSVQQIAATYVVKLRTLQPHGPYYLCGHSFGGVVVYEMAVLLAAAGEPVGLVALIDTLHPAFRRNMSVVQHLRFRSVYMADRIAKYLRNLRHGRLRRIGGEARHFVQTRCRLAIWKIARVVGGQLGGPIPGAIKTNEMVLVSAWNRYQSTTYGGRLVLLNAVDRPPEYGRDRTLGWGKYVSGGIEIHLVPGNHLSIMHLPDVLGLAERIRFYLTRY